MNNSNMTMADAVQSGFEHFTNWNGRASRSAYWWLFLATAIAVYIPIFLGLTIGGIVGGLFTLIGVLASIAFILPNLSACVRRLHDTGRSGWWYWISIVPLIGVIWLLVLLVLESEAGENQYGPNPEGGVSGSEEG